MRQNYSSSSSKASIWYLLFCLLKVSTCIAAGDDLSIGLHMDVNGGFPFCVCSVIIYLNDAPLAQFRQVEVVSPAPQNFGESHAILPRVKPTRQALSLYVHVLSLFVMAVATTLKSGLQASEGNPSSRLSKCRGFKLLKERRDHRPSSRTRS